MLLQLYNLTEGQGNPSYLSGILPGGAGGNAVAGTTAVPFLAQPTAESIIREVLDFTYFNSNANAPTPYVGQTAIPAINGQLVVEQFYKANPGGANWALSQIAGQICARNTYGIVNGAALSTDTISAPGGESRVVVDGYANAYCTTGSSTAIAPGTPLVADGEGNLTPAPTTTGTAPTNGTAVVVTPQGTVGTSSYSYEIAGYSADGSSTAVSSAGSTTTGNAVLTPVNNNKITWTAGANSVSYAIIRSAVPSGSALTTGIIGYAANGTTGFVDAGQPSQGAYGGANTTVFDPVAGSVLAIALGSLATSTSTPTLVPVKVGGY